MKCLENYLVEARTLSVSCITYRDTADHWPVILEMTQMAFNGPIP